MHRMPVLVEREGQTIFLHDKTRLKSFQHENEMVSWVGGGRREWGEENQEMD
jgi:hypothetical protein